MDNLNGNHDRIMNAAAKRQPHDPNPKVLTLTSPVYGIIAAGRLRPAEN
jgi:hypothetical protein